MDFEALLASHGDEPLAMVWDNYGLVDLKDGYPSCCGHCGFTPLRCAKCGHIMIYCYECGLVTPDPANPARTEKTEIDDPGSFRWAPTIKCFSCQGVFRPDLNQGSHDATLRQWVEAGHGNFIVVSPK